MILPRVLLAFLLFMQAVPVDAGTACKAEPIGASQLAAAAETALRTKQALDLEDAPIALLSRVGTDVSSYGLVYSHVGFVLRDHPAGRWTVVHLLNTCGTERSALFAEGLVNFFTDDLVNQDARITWIEPQLADRLLAVLLGDGVHEVHQPRYSVIARPDSRRFQNSTGWALEALMAAQLAGHVDRVRTQAMATAQGFEPDLIPIDYTQRLAGALFAANASFTDHPVGTRLSGRYPVVTVRAILRHLGQHRQIRREREWRGGAELHAPGAA